MGQLLIGARHLHLPVLSAAPFFHGFLVIEYGQDVQRVFSADKDKGFLYMASLILYEIFSTPTVTALSSCAPSATMWMPVRSRPRSGQPEPRSKLLTSPTRLPGITATVSSPRFCSKQGSISRLPRRALCLGMVGPSSEKGVAHAS